MQAKERDTSMQSNKKNRYPSSDTNDCANEMLSLGTALHIVENDYRRRILFYLSEYGSGAPLREIVQYLVQCEEGDDARFPSEEYRRVYTTVTQNHLDVLKNENVISEGECDRRIYCESLPPVLENLVRQQSDESEEFA
jgi:hypothetical protein